MALHKNEKFVITFIIVLAKGLFTSNHTTPMTSGFRKMHESGINSLLPLQQQLARAKAGKDVGIYEPFWENGEWVFDREKAGRNTRPKGNILNVGTTENDHCDQLCPDAYEDYGQVCGQRLKNGKSKPKDKRWIYEFKDFENMCYLELENCQNETKHWFPVHRGKCPELYDRSTHPTNADEIVRRLTQWIKRAP